MPKKYLLDVTPANAQRRSHLAQEGEWIRAFLERARIGHIATQRGEQPFISPTTFWYDVAAHALYFHSNLVGRIRANSEHHSRVCFEASEFGRVLPSNIALEFSLQCESVVAFGAIRVVEEEKEKRRILYGLIRKYFPAMRAGKEFRPITGADLERTSVYAIAIESWSGKRNWKDQAEQSEEWAPLADRSSHRKGSQ